MTLLTIRYETIKTMCLLHPQLTSICSRHLQPGTINDPIRVVDDIALLFK